MNYISNNNNKQVDNSLITVIIAVNNGAKTLQRCIDSVLNQTYLCKELIIMDGGSDDGTVEILKTNEDKISYWESRPDKGICHAWNKALDHSRGDWICFLGSDDFFWTDDVLVNMATYLKDTNPTIPVVYGRVALVGKNSTYPLAVVGNAWDEIKEKFFRKMAIPHQGVFHRKDLFLDVGKFDESFKIAGDYELLLRALKSRSAHFVSDVIVAGMQLGGISNNPCILKIIFKEITLARKINRIKLSTYCNIKELFLSGFFFYSRVLISLVFEERGLDFYERNYQALRKLWLK